MYKDHPVRRWLPLLLLIPGFTLVAAHPPAASAAPGDWLEYHADDGHSGAVSAPPLVPAQPAWTSPALDGKVYGEPLSADGLLFAATTNDTVYGIDPGSGAVRWSTHVGTPVPLSMLPCGNVNPLGILSTAVVVESLHRVYVVAEERTLIGVQHELVGLDTTTGSIAVRKVVDPPGMNVITQQQRGALLLDQGRVLVPFGGLDGDCGQYHGWLVAANEDGSGGLLAFHTPGNEVGMWAASGPVQDGAGNIYAATGNGSSTSTYDEGNSVLKLSPTLQLEDSFAEPNWAADNGADADLGSAGPVLLSNNLVFVAGKPGKGYLLDTSHLGGVGGQVFSGDVGCPSFGGDAWAAPVVYVWCDGGPVRAFTVDTTARKFSPLWESDATGGPPIVAGGAVWAEDSSGGTLRAFDPATGHTLQSFPTGGAARFVTPMVAGNEVVVAAGAQLRAFTAAVSIALPFWAASADGGVYSSGGAPFLGSAGGLRLARPVVGIAATPDHGGYWLVATDGGIFSFGDAHFYGSTGAIHLNQPIVGMAATPDGAGYWLVASDGGIFSFGDAHFYGSTGAIHLNQPIVGMARPDAGGYWIVAADGGIFAFGDAPFLGSAAGAGLGARVVGMAPGAGKSYAIVAANGSAELVASAGKATIVAGRAAAPFVGAAAAG